MNGIIFKVYELVRSGGRTCRRCIFMSADKLRAMDKAAEFALKKPGSEFRLTQCDVFDDFETDIDTYRVRA